LYSFIVIIHILACLSMILVVLLQTGKGADMGAAFGGSSQTIFGSSGAGTFLGKVTTGIAVVFMLTSLWLAYFAVQRSDSVVREARAVPAAERSVDRSSLPAELPESVEQPAAETFPGNEP